MGNFSITACDGSFAYRWLCCIIISDISDIFSGLGKDSSGSREAEAEGAEGFYIAQRGRSADYSHLGKELGHLESFSQLCCYFRTVVRKPSCRRQMHSTMEPAWL